VIDYTGLRLRNF